MASRADGLPATCSDIFGTKVPTAVLPDAGSAARHAPGPGQRLTYQMTMMTAITATTMSANLVSERRLVRGDRA
jgi:hypothetical protein